MSLTARAALSLFALYRKAVAEGDLEAMKRIGAAAEAMEDPVPEEFLFGDPPPPADAQPGDLPDAPLEAVPDEVPEAKRLKHPEGSGIVIGGVFAPADKVTVCPPSRRKAASSIQPKHGPRRPTQRAAKWIAADRQSNSWTSGRRR